MAVPFDPHAAEREKWRAFPRVRPANILPPGVGQRSVWDFPRPPRVEPVPLPVRVEFGGRVIARSDRALRVCETASPPGYYVPPADVDADRMLPSARTSFCEWKGEARYWSVRAGGREAKDAAWSYPEPYPEFEVIRDYFAFYPRRMDGCWVGDERVEPQPGFYYGGWVTRDLVGPFKGGAGVGRVVGEGYVEPPLAGRYQMTISSPSAARSTRRDIGQATTVFRRPRPDRVPER